MNIKRVWAMPAGAHTFDCKPIGDFVQKYLSESRISLDPFAGNKHWATYTNDLNPQYVTNYHLDALEFLQEMRDVGVRPDFVIFDPPYSPRQIKELYDSIGLTTYQEMAHKTAGWKSERDIINEILQDEGVVVTCNWNSCGMGKGRGYEILEILLVCHGAAHNDTICMAERKRKRLL